MLSVVAISGGVSTVVGGYMLRRQLGSQAENRVRQDLNAAREFYQQHLASMTVVLKYTALGERFSEAVARKDVRYVATRLQAVRKSAGFDMMCVVDEAGKVTYRVHNPGYSGDSLTGGRLVRRVLQSKQPAAGTMLVPIDILRREIPPLAERASIRIFDTPRARPSERARLESAMMLWAAVPVHGPGGRMVGVLRAGVLLNRNYGLVDQVQNTVFRDEKYRGKLLGTATIFQDDVRISTNVQRQDGSRAIGTRVSAEVYDHVLGKGRTWIGPAWVVNDWYISAYEPIHDIDGNPIGILYVGVLQRKFGDTAVRTFTIFALVAFVVLLIAGLVAWRLAESVARPIGTLAKAVSAVASGDFSQSLPVVSRDEIASLTETFNAMAQSLKERDELLKEQARMQLTRSERLASVGRLAAGVAHEINNPLTGVLTFAHVLRDDAQEGSQQREDAETIIEATTRCKDVVRGLLGFSRQTEPHKTAARLGEVLHEALNLTQNQARLNKVEVVEEIAPDLPALVIDPNQIQEVAVNLTLNALDAMPEGGTLTLRARRSETEEGDWVQFEVEDTGMGIPEEALGQIFDPFFTTKPAGQGTGLGLAIAYGIVTEHGGQITVSSEVDRGTTFTVRLPTTAEEPHHGS
jgi:two-component system NtrC family sensor kinase